MIMNENKNLLTIKSGGIISGINSIHVSLLMNSIVFCNIAIAD